MDDVVARFEQALLDLDHVRATRILDEAAAGRPPGRVVDEVVSPALVRIGAAWENGDLALSQVYMSGRLCERLVRTRRGDDVPARAQQPRICVAVLDDSHILGKQIVTQMLSSAGYAFTDLGSGVSVDDLVEATVDLNLEVLVLSVLMLRSALEVADLRLRLQELAIEPVIVVGGAPFRFDPHLADEVGADYFGTSASDILGIMARIEEARR